MEMKDLVQNGFDNAKRTLDRTLDGLTAEELKWQPKPDANSIGLILFHMIRIEDSMVHRIQGKPQIWETEKWYQKFNKTIEDGGAHYTAEQVAAFVVPDVKDLLAYSEMVRKNTLEYLKGLKPKDFDKKVNLPPPPTPVVVPAGRPIPTRPFNPIVGSMLVHEVTELAGHAGEISYIRGLQRGMDK
jgi:uncharacterized damage-inducible protein DinB